VLVDNGRFILDGYVWGSKGFGASLEEFTNLSIFFEKYHHLNFELDLFGYSEWCLFGLWRLKDCY